MTTQPDWPVAIIGSGNIGTDLMIKILRSDRPLHVAAMVGIDPNSDGLARAERLGVPITASGVDGLLGMPDFSDIKLIFDATSAVAHRANWTKLEPTGVRVLDLTPAAIGPYCVPAINLDAHLDAPNLNMVTCGGQATVPIVAAVAQTGIVSYAEIVSSIASKSTSIILSGVSPGSPHIQRTLRSFMICSGRTPKSAATWASDTSVRVWR